jgi:hypothetical protein
MVFGLSGGYSGHHRSFCFHIPLLEEIIEALILGPFFLWKEKPAHPVPGFVLPLPLLAL